MANPDTHAELIEDLAEVAAYRWLSRPRSAGDYRRWMRLREASKALGNIGLASQEDWDDASAEADADLRMGLSIRAGWIEQGIATI